MILGLILAGIGIGFVLGKYVTSKVQYYEYIIRPLDTCEKIAYEHNVSTESIVEANDVLKPQKCTVIYIGQKISIPYSQHRPIGYSGMENLDCHTIIYQPSRREDIYAIALKFNITTELIRKYNRLENDLLGQEIIIPICSEK
jgi:LysM repeat protein